MLRTLITKTPGKAVIDAGGTPVHLYSSTGISVELLEEVQVISTDRAGSHDERPIGRMVQVKMTPTQFTAAALAKLFTHGAVRKGGSILASTDKTLDIHTVDGKRRRIVNAFVYGEPACTFKTGSTILGEVTFWGIVPLGGDAASLASFYNKSDVAFDHTGWDRDNELTPGWDISWSTDEESAWYALDTTGGLVATPRSVLDVDRSDRDGVKNVTIRDYGVDIKASVLNIGEDDVLEVTGWNNKLGSSRAALGRDLVLRSTNEDAFATFYNAVLQQPYSFRMAAENTVVADLNWTTRPDFTNGLMGAHLLVTTTDPEA